ncbi:DUF5131 family protein [Sinorhizobium medicae]|uniref:phage Gp37/Gp68 family protein n=1 Tax=Sinorhizobium medicae TaxID=110321 RepID=UPI000FD7A6B0|nr:phage Gp37/Gp68 family protein [Sinorhizobium medicae]MDX0601667.1 DUF5131 family protein [Sinorhizobium medicae]MDX0765467.1 DUF5131 family protein [Sinorhizobium medicae]MDX0818179.1 DUF5131 family protein [Sinorhizobium medicae]MDX0826881.1 DUF5131 family protein [Sinorhizobium medicae]MDX0861184.1 DUF5131 family protein [Sinorhizobium medicae]
MADGTKIEWTDATWNPITGCAVVSPGCTNCYAMKLAGTRLRNHESRKGLTKDSKAGPVWTGEMCFNRQWLDQPLRWSKPRMIFVCAHGDLFAEGVPGLWIDHVFSVMALAPQHTFQVLTKRPQRMREYFTGRRANFGRASEVLHEHISHGLSEAEHQDAVDLLDLFDSMGKILPNVWLGVSVEDQKRADERIPILLDTPAAVRWISAEPLLGPISFRWAAWQLLSKMEATNHLDGLRRLDWVVAGGESGAGARPMHPDWARKLRDQCAEAQVPFLFKQWREWVPQVGAVEGWTIPDDPEISRIDHRDWEGDHWGEPYSPMWCDERNDDTVSRVGKRYAGPLLDGVEHNSFPEVRR